MRNVAISLGIACVVISSASANITPVTLRTEYLVNPMAVDTDSPRLFWKVTSKERNQRQSAYQIRVSNSVQALQAGNANLWDTRQPRLNTPEKSCSLHKQPSGRFASGTRMEM